jgi:outer membrane protein OmpU
MNKLSKIGCSALCGSLAAISAANAGDLTVTGGVDMTWVSLDSNSTGNPLGIGSNLTFTGSGEADNGWTWDLTVANLNANAYSAAKVDVGMGGLGNIMLNQGDGNGLGAYDDKMPTAWEEAWGAGLNPDVQLVGGVGTSMNLQYTTPTVLGTKVVLAYAPEVGASDTADKASSGAASNELKKGYDAVIHMNPSLGTEILSGLNLYVGGSFREKTVDSGTYQQDQGDLTGQITFDIGPLSLGYGVSGIVTGYEARGAASNPDFYKSHMYGVAFNVNDDLAVSYGYHDTRMEGVTTRDGSLNIEQNRYVEVSSFQVSYTMGGASLRVADVEAKNVGFSNADSADREATVISVGLAF